jgi:lia operon protein LiaI
MLTSQKEASSEEYHYSSPVVSDPVTKSSFDTEWEDFLKKDK